MDADLLQPGDPAEDRGTPTHPRLLRGAGRLAQRIELAHQVRHDRLIGAHLFLRQFAVHPDHLPVRQVRRDARVGLDAAQHERPHHGAQPRHRVLVVAGEALLELLAPRQQPGRGEGE